MHELGLARDIWHIIIEKAGEKKFSKITRIVIAVGETSGIDIHFLRHSLVEHIIPGTIAGEAKIDIVEELLIAECKDCRLKITKDMVSSFTCPGCGNMNIEIVSGKEVYVQSIEGI